MNIETAAASLDRAALSAQPIAQLTAETTLNLSDGYAIQAALITRRLARGDRVIGIKLGFTSRAKALQMGVEEVILGRLTAAMTVDDGGELDLDALVHPRVEPELAFRLGRAIDADTPLAALSSALDGVAPALEVIDSRYRDFRFSLPDVVADNTSAAAYAVGPWSSPDGDLGNRGVLLEIDGQVVQTGSTAAILGHPLRALTQAVTLARRLGIDLPAGTILLAGAATAAVALPPGATVRAIVAGLGTATLRTAGAA